FSQVIRAGDFLFVSGQTAYNPDTKTVEVEGIQEQTELVLKRIKELLEDCGSGLDEIVNARVFLQDASYFETMNLIFKEYFKNNFPTRTTVGVNLIADVKIEIDVIAYSPQRNRGNKSGSKVAGDPWRT